METTGIFQQYADVLEFEQDVRDRIVLFEIKALDKIISSINVQREEIHDASEESIESFCKFVRKELCRATGIYQRIADQIPAMHFYKYSSLFRYQTQRLVEAAALMTYLHVGKLLTLEEAAKLLGLKPADTWNSPHPTFDGIQDKVSINITETASSVGSLQKPKESAETVEAHSEESEGVAGVATSPLAVSVDSGCKPKQQGKVCHLATSNTGTQLIVTPATPTRTPDPRDLTQETIIEDLTRAARELSEESTETPSVSPDPPLPARPILSMIGLDDMVLLDTEDFLLGCLTMTSELARLAVNAVAAGNYSLPFQINKFLRQLHSAFSLLNLKNNLLRKTFDELKYSLKKTEEVVYNLSLRKLFPAKPDLLLEQV